MVVHKKKFDFWYSEIDFGGFLFIKKTKTFQVATGKLRASLLVHEFSWRRVWMWRSYACTLGYIHVMADSAMRTKTTTKSERAVRLIPEFDPYSTGLFGVCGLKQTCKRVFLVIQYTNS